MLPNELQPEVTIRRCNAQLTPRQRDMHYSYSYYILKHGKRLRTHYSLALDSETSPFVPWAAVPWYRGTAVMGMLAPIAPMLLSISLKSKHAAGSMWAAFTTGKRPWETWKGRLPGG